jgi:hypothetical protein
MMRIKKPPVAEGGGSRCTSQGNHRRQKELNDEYTYFYIFCQP